MKFRLYLIFLYFSLHSLAVFAQQKPAGYYASVLSRYKYKGRLVQKGDLIPLADGDTLTVKEIQKFNVRYSEVYYLAGKNKSGKKVYYNIAQLLGSDDATNPGAPEASGITETRVGIFPAENNKVVYTQLSEAPGLTAAALYDNTLTNLVNTHRDGGIRLQDYALGHFIISDWDTLYYSPLFDTNGWKEVKISYLCDILVKDGKFRVRLYDIGLECVSAGDGGGSIFLAPEELAGPAPPPYPGLAEELDSTCRRITDTLAEAIGKPSDAGW